MLLGALHLHTLLAQRSSGGMQSIERKVDSQQDVEKWKENLDLRARFGVQKRILILTK